jgi:hypothetical protein
VSLRAKEAAFGKRGDQLRGIVSDHVDRRRHRLKSEVPSGVVCQDIREARVRPLEVEPGKVGGGLRMSGIRS